MKARLMLAVPLMVGVAFAQSSPQSGSSAAQTGTTSGSGNAAEMKTTTYRGTLVDLSCGSATAATASAASDTSSPNTAASSANRAAGDTSNCPATASSSQFGLKMENGQVVRFDLVGNQRAQDEFKNNKKWTSAASSNKAIMVKISGVMQGDKLIVSSIH